MPPLLPLPEDNTIRGYINYTSGGLPHTASFRVPDATIDGDLVNVLAWIADSMIPLMDPGDSITTYERSAKNSNVRFIIGTDGRAGTAVGGVNNEINRSVAMSLTGKGLDGRIVACSFFTILAAAFVDTRLPIGVVAPNVAAWYDAITVNPSGEVVTIGLATVGWNGYINVRRDAYWQRQQR